MKIKDYFKAARDMLLMAFIRAERDRVMYNIVNAEYERKWEDKGFQNTDKLSICPASIVVDVYRIARTQYRYQFDEINLHAVIEQNSEWYAVYNRVTHQLQEVNGGKVCTFLPEQQVLLMQGLEYKKIVKGGKAV